MSRKDWSLLAISSAGEEGISPVRLQKSLFLLGKMLPEALGERYYRFVPYDYGPFDSTVYADVEVLRGKGYVMSRPAPGQRWSEYVITDKGLKYLEARKSKAPRRAVDYLKTVVKWALSLSFQQLVSSIYAEFPEFRKNSVFQERTS